MVIHFADKNDSSETHRLLFLSTYSLKFLRIESITFQRLSFWRVKNLLCRKSPACLLFRLGNMTLLCLCFVMGQGLRTCLFFSFIIILNGPLGSLWPISLTPLLVREVERAFISDKQCKVCVYKISLNLFYRYHLMG